jgi:hypothetical protein
VGEWSPILPQPDVAPGIGNVNIGGYSPGTSLKARDNARVDLSETQFVHGKRTMAANKRAGKYDFVPEALRDRFPGNWVLLLEKSTRLAVWVTMLFVAFLVHLGAFFQAPSYTESWVVLISAGLCPVAFAAGISFVRSTRIGPNLRCATG